MTVTMIIWMLKRIQVNHRIVHHRQKFSTHRIFGMKTMKMKTINCSKSSNKIQSFKLVSKKRSPNFYKILPQPKNLPNMLSMWMNTRKMFCEAFKWMFKNCSLSYALKLLIQNFDSSNFIVRKRKKKKISICCNSIVDHDLDFVKRFKFTKFWNYLYVILYSQL